MEASLAFSKDGVILSFPAGMDMRDLIKLIAELEKMALEDYVRRTVDQGHGT